MKFIEIFLILVFLQVLITESCIQPYWGVEYYSESVCVIRFLICIIGATVTRQRNILRYRCCPGWSGYDCQTPFCNCRNGGRCVAPNVCRCPAEYRGENCEIPVCSGGCGYGHCTVPKQCTCYPGYTGAKCNIPVCNPSCLNNGRCVRPNTCQCNGYSGRRCEKPICSPPCMNGGTCNRYRRCSCTSNYRGPHCTVPVCSPSCGDRGTCVAPNQCKCHGTFTGSACQNPICFGSCGHGYCSSPGHCTCYHGYTGARCNIPVCNPPCLHNGKCVGPNTCQCQGYFGNRCEHPICSPLCMNGGTCSQSRQCVCTSSYTGQDCTIPVCRPSCRNGGTCVAPNQCSCDSTYTGSTCETPLCSYHTPCFPGSCNDTVHCQCKEGFRGGSGLELCRSMTSLEKPTIGQCNSFLANIERTGQKRELYRYMADSSGVYSTRLDTRWVNQKDYNYINIQFSATFQNLAGLMFPQYVKEFKFGIVSGMVQMDLSKTDRKDPSKPFISINSTILDCPHNPGSISPNEDVYWCNLTNPNFDRLLEHGDNLTLTAIATNGGYRTIKTPNGQKVNTFIGQNSSKTTQFRFDFVNPHHCLLDGNCHSVAFNVDKDITKESIHFTWDGWFDEMSGIEKYTIQKYFLTANNEIPTRLHEPDPWAPMQTFELKNTADSFAHLPDKPGMYSFLLNVIDAANNTEYGRTLVLYDPASEITVSNTPSDTIKTMSAKEETGYTWQDNLDMDIEISWKNHFENKFHTHNKWLNPVKPFKYYQFTTNIKKYVNPRMEDRDGKRTLNGIRNINGIIKFDYAYRHGNLGNSTPNQWTPVNNSFSENQTFFITRRDGDAITFWIRATDVMGNAKTDMTHVYFDSSPPQALSSTDVSFTPNLNLSTYSFSSRVQVDAVDHDSGIFKIDWRLIANESGTVFKSGNISGNKTMACITSKDWKVKDPGYRNGYEIVSGEFFYINHYLDINNCWMVVSKDNFQAEFVLLELTVFNMAMKSTVYNTTISDLNSLDGIDEYSGPMHLHVTKTYHNGVRLKWIVAPSCYSRSKIVVRYFSSDGKKFSRFVDKNADWFDLTGLDSETKYNLSFVTEYSDQQSDPVYLSFTTLEAPGLTAGAIAGISIVIILLLGSVITMVVLWRMGRLSLVKERIQRRVTVVRKRINNRFSTAHNNQSFDEDIYIYGHMEFNETDSWILPSTTITLESLITSGRFADIYRAIYKSKRNTDERGIVVAKVMKSGFTDEDALMMKAKINFFGKQVGEHQNILLFVGAVVDNGTLGPYMILELCEKGQLRDWLLQQKNETTEDTIEQLCRIIYGISRGMCHLETKRIVHRKLAARNVLLTDDLEPKIYGFGPEPPQKGDRDGDGNAKSDDKERIPIKWTAPECLTSMKDTTSKSDVWSFGVLVWEVFSFGDSPYPGMRSREIKQEVNNGHRMKRPEFANDFYYKLMLQCWQAKPKQRPTFKEVMKDIGETFNSTPSDECYYYSEK